MNKKINSRFGILALFVFIAAMSRFIPHPPNFTPIGSMALFGAAYFSRKHLAFLIPFIAMWFSDLLLNNTLYAPYFDGISLMGSIWVYAGFALIVGAGFLLLKKVKIANLLIASVLASVVFFLVTNFGSWVGNPIYPKNASGLAMSYAAGIPFFWSTLLGNLFYTAVLFGGFEWVKSRFPNLQKVEV